MKDEAKPFRAKSGPKPKLYFFKGGYRSVPDIAARLGVADCVLRRRLKSGELPEQAFDGLRTSGGRPCALYTFNGESLTLAEWAKRLGLSRAALFDRINLHCWTIEEAFTTPPIKRGYSRKTMNHDRRMMKIRLPARPSPHATPGGCEQTSKGTTGTGGGRSAPETAYPGSSFENENESEAGR